MTNRIAYKRDWRKAHKAQTNQTTKAWRAAHPEARKRHAHAGYIAARSYRRADCRARNHQITIAEYDRMMTEQDSRCALCCAVFTEFHVNRQRSPNIDHNHACPDSGRHKRRIGCSEGGCAECVRGLICRRCNLIVVPFLELYPDRQTAAEQVYMATRPVKRYRAAYHLSGHVARSAFQ